MSVGGDRRTAPDMVTPTWVRQPPAHGPRLVHVSAPGGVADLLRGLVRAQAAAGTPIGWAVIAGSSELFAVTRYLAPWPLDRADAAGPDDAETTARYRSAVALQARWLAGQLAADDVVVLHDPPTLGLAPWLAETGARVVWHCHAGAAAGPAAIWRELAPELSTLDAVVTASVDFGPPPVPAIRWYACAAAVDPWSPRNRELDPDEVDKLLAEIGLTCHLPAGSDAAVVEQHGPVPAGARVVLHVASWDPLANVPGLLGCLPGLPADVHLVLAGPDPTAPVPTAPVPTGPVPTGPDLTGTVPADPAGMAADPAAAAALDAVRAAVAGLSIVDRLRVHLVLATGGDPDRAGLLLNAVQRRADVVLQASPADGRGLTVPEAMAKRRAVLVAASGPRIDTGKRHAVVAALRVLLDDPQLRHEVGERAAEVVAGHYSMARLVSDYRTFAALTPMEFGLRAAR